MSNEKIRAEISSGEKKLSDDALAVIQAELREDYEEASSWYAPVMKKMYLLDAVDKTMIWQAVQAKFPKYQILTDTNFVHYVKQNLLASLYTVAKSAEVLPTQEGDIDAVANFNTYLDHLWQHTNISKHQFLAGDNAALFNLGLTQVGWSEEEGDSSNLVFKNLDPMGFMRDIYANDLKSSEWCCYTENYGKSFFANDPKYADRFKKVKNKLSGTDTSMSYNNKIDSRPTNNSDDTYKLTVFWRKEVICDNPDAEDSTERVIYSEYHSIDCKEIVWYKRDIKPSRFPIVPLYCNNPKDSLIGTSEPQVMFTNSVAYNLMDSLMFTAEYKNQRPPKFISASAGLNIDAFSKYGDDANMAFPVQGDASKAVHYMAYPNISQSLPNSLMRMESNIKTITGVDDRYTGRDTGSIITTGGTEEMLNRVTMIDAPKVKNYEDYMRDLTELVILNLCHYSPEREYLVKRQNRGGAVKWETRTIAPMDMFEDAEDAKTMLNYSISISSELPSNKQRLAAWANMIIEKQMQYSQEGGGQVQFISNEEWLMLQDIPAGLREMMLDRMGVERSEDVMAEVASIVDQFGSLFEEGASPEEALAMTAGNVAEQRYGTPNPMAEEGGEAPMGMDPMSMMSEPMQ